MQVPEERGNPGPKREVSIGTEKASVALEG